MTKKEYFGFFEFELEEKKEFHEGAIRLNCARQAINYIIKAHNYQKILVPHYICNTVYEALTINYEFYYLNDDLTPKLKDSDIDSNTVILYPNYFGTNNLKALEVKTRYPNVILDNTQAFFHKLTNNDVVYSPRKFFGVADGAYLYCQKKIDIELERDVSFQRMLPLLKRIELGANAAYEGSLRNEEEISNSGMKKMSLLTEKILKSIDYEKMMAIRKQNFSYLERHLGSINELIIIKDEDQIPMVYPMLLNKPGLREKLVQNKVYVPCWWKEASKRVNKSSLEAYLSECLLPLPIDQRYNSSDLDYILGLIF